MARSGANSHYLRIASLFDGTAKYGSANPLHSAYSYHCLVKSSGAPIQTDYRFAMGLCGDTSLNQQRPQNDLTWDHMSAGFNHAMYHRNASGTYTSAQTTTTPSINTWYSYGCSFDSTNLRVWLNGVNEATIASTVSQNKTIWLSILGSVLSTGAASSPVTQFSNGEIAEAAFWNATLGADDFNALAKGFSPQLVRPQNLFSYVPLVRVTRDMMGNVTWNEINSPTTTDHPRVFQ